MTNKYIGIEFFEKNRDHSSRVIHDMRKGQAAYKAFIRPKQMTFGVVSSGSTSPIQTAVVRNVGYKDLPIGSVKSVGQFRVTHDAPAVLKPRESFEIAVAFMPVSQGFLSGGIYINTGNAQGDEFIELIGYGQGEGPTPDLPYISISDGVIEELPFMSVSYHPSSLDFGEVEIDLSGSGD